MIFSAHRLPTSLAIVLGTVMLFSAIAIAQQMPVIDSQPRRPLMPGRIIVQQTPATGTEARGIVVMRPPFQEDAERARIRTIRENALRVMADANQRTVSAGAILLVNTTQGLFNLEFERGGAWMVAALAPLEIKEIVCAECGAQIKLRFNDTRAPQTLSFGVGTKLALVWVNLASNFQILPIPSAVALFQ